MLDILVFISLILLSAIPVTKSCFWIYSKAKYIDNQLEKGKQLIVFSRYSLVLGASYLLHFLKGFFVPYFTSTYYIDNNLLLITSMVVLLGCHFFPFFLKFSFQKESLLFYGEFIAFLQLSFYIFFQFYF